MNKCIRSARKHHGYERVIGKLTLVFCLLFLTIQIPLIAQTDNVGIGTTTPDNSAILDLDVSSLTDKKGFLAPRVALDDASTEAPITSPAKGLLIFNEGGTEAEGFYYWGGSQWIQVGAGSSSLPSGTAEGQTLKYDSVNGVWEVSSLIYNDGTNVGIGKSSSFQSRFVVKGSGNTDATSAFGITNSDNTFTLIAKDDGRIGIGTYYPDAYLDVPYYTRDSNTVQFGSFGIQATGSTNGFLANNGYWSGSQANMIYRENGRMAMFQFLNGQIRFLNAPPGSAGDQATGLKSYLMMEQNGHIGIGPNISNVNEVLTLLGTFSIAEQSDEVTTTADFGKMYVKSDDSQLWFKDDNGDSTQLSYEYAVFEDRKSAGSDGGTFSSGSWVTRDLNSDVESRGSSISLNTSTGVITLDKGTYKITGSAPGHRVDNHKARLRQTNNTPATVIYGTTEKAANGSNVQTRSMIDGIINVSQDGTTFEVQHRCESNQTDDGLGAAFDFGEQEVYTRIMIQKIR